MSFCTNCGSPITEGQTHVCQASVPSVPASQQASSQASPQDSQQAPQQASQPSGFAGGEPNARNYGELVKGELSKFEKGTLLELLKNPLSALQLRGESDLRYGLIGLAASLIGYMLWAWSLKRNVIHTVFELSGGGSRSEWREGYKYASDQFAILSPMFVLGLVSLIALTAGAILLGGGLGTHKVSWKESLAKIGAVQLSVGAGFLVSALMLFVSLRFGFVVLTVVVLSALALTLFAAAQLFRVSQARILPLVGLFMLLVVAVTAITFNLQLQAAFEKTAAQFMNFF
ncbi:hypothetical protein [Saccharibacillus alkalitolerans]|uniref:Zinc ribbon domain-containing protein n=1 Tax=Saccharibacillus alkalitolerans TaxID=2705290 RepID=A0ABX0F2R1_9BACL|nr:hypothetical protein [Saccharibacillus alkalitolerans]NGZ75277.1 hypothetical protein [Saccharibacillus alkalitolerans]